MPFQRSGLPSGETSSFPRVPTNLVWAAATEGARLSRIMPNQQACVLRDRIICENTPMKPLNSNENRVVLVRTLSNAFRKHTRNLCVTLRKPLRPQRLNFKSPQGQQTFTAELNMRRWRATE